MSHQSPVIIIRPRFIDQDHCEHCGRELADEELLWKRDGDIICETCDDLWLHQQHHGGTYYDEAAYENWKNNYRE